MNEQYRDQLLRIVIALSSNHMERVYQHLRRALEIGIPHEEVYEAILQIHLFAGYPASIEGLNALHSVYGQIVQPGEGIDISLFEQRGEKLCREIYTTVYDKMIQKMNVISPDLARWMILDGYGKTLSRPALHMQYRELINLVILAIGRWTHQFISHLRGSLNIGITMQEIFDSINILKEEDKIASHDFALSVIAEYQSI